MWGMLGDAKPPLGSELVVGRPRSVSPCLSNKCIKSLKKKVLRSVEFQDKPTEFDSINKIASKAHTN